MKWKNINFLKRYTALDWETGVRFPINTQNTKSGWDLKICSIAKLQCTELETCSFRNCKKPPTAFTDQKIPQHFCRNRSFNLVAMTKFHYEQFHLAYSNSTNSTIGKWCLVFQQQEVNMFSFVDRIESCNLLVH